MTTVSFVVHTTKKQMSLLEKHILSHFMEMCRAGRR